MAKFKFTLQAALKHRKIKEDLVQKEYQDAVSILRQFESELEKLMLLEAEARHKASHKQIQGGMDIVSSVQQINDFIKLNTIRIEQQKKKILEQEKLVEVKREILRLAAIDRKILERFKEKKRDEWKLETDLKEQKEVDEMNVIRFSREDQ